MTLRRIDGTWPDDLVEAVARAHCDHFGGAGWYESAQAFGLYSDMRDAAIAALDAIEAWEGK